MPSLLLVAAMTVSEVTTRIALVGIVSLAGLMLVARRSAAQVAGHQHRRVHITGGSQDDPAARLSRYPQVSSAPFRALGLLALAVVAGAGLGVMASSSLLLVLGSADVGQ